MRGDEVLNQIRADGRLSRIPVVVVTADATEGQRESMLALGAVDYLTKPFGIARLLHVVDTYCSDPMRRPRVLYAEDEGKVCRDLHWLAEWACGALRTMPAATSSWMMSTAGMLVCGRRGWMCRRWQTCRGGCASSG